MSSVRGSEGPFLHRLRQLAPVLGIGLLVLSAAGWPLGVQLESGSAGVSEWPQQSIADTRDNGATVGGKSPGAERSLAAEDAVLNLLEGEAVDDDRHEPVEALLVAAAEPTSEPTATVARSPRFDQRVGDPRDRVIPTTLPVVKAALPPDRAVPPTVAASTPQQEATAASRPRSGVVSYVVAPGDTLTRIAARFGVSVETIRAANALDSADLVRLGRTLVVPTEDGAVHLVERGETLTSIAARYGVSRLMVAAANSLSGDMILAGQYLLIPGVVPLAVARATPTTGAALASRAAPTASRVPTPKPTPRPAQRSR